MNRLLHKLVDSFNNFRRRPNLAIIIGLTISMLFLVLFSKLAAETLYENEMHEFDLLITGFIRYPAGQALDSFMLWVTKLGSVTVVLAVTCSLLAFLLLRGRRHEANALLLCLAGAALLNQLLKFLYARARPDLFRVVEESGYSFPSGHSMVSFCLYGFLAYIFSRDFSSICRSWLIYSVAGLVVSLIGISRIYLGVHYPTDVLAGFVAGGTWLSFCTAWLHWREYRAERRPER